MAWTAVGEMKEALTTVCRYDEEKALYVRAAEEMKDKEIEFSDQARYKWI